VSGSLKVNTDELRNVSAAFTAASEKLAGLHADAPLGDAAAAVPGLQTGAACAAAKGAVAEQMTAIANGAKVFGSNLSDAAGKYESTDQASGNNIAGVNVPAPAPR
jgi:hypothetical protein